MYFQQQELWKWFPIKVVNLSLMNLWKFTLGCQIIQVGCLYLSHLLSSHQQSRGPHLLIIIIFWKNKQVDKLLKVVVVLILISHIGASFETKASASESK